MLSTGSRLIGLMCSFEERSAVKNQGCVAMDVMMYRKEICWSKSGMVRQLCRCLYVIRRPKLIIREPV